ncbi:C-type lectin domain family 4 member M-like [Neocloeon triangulifer]|uniref:C-type lectin domain family 4 member M-like n=1 Tax=Neocloeon triangulifer TaxID=2078957 RepID=UPI00286F6F7E|nr:C-type lectin domain family 4 member M-like [Neocloeon triangulifer]
MKPNKCSVCLLALIAILTLINFGVFLYFAISTKNKFLELVERVEKYEQDNALKLKELQNRDVRIANITTSPTPSSTSTSLITTILNRCQTALSNNLTILDVGGVKYRYFVSKGKANWNTANSVCKQRQMNLAKFESVIVLEEFKKTINIASDMWVSGVSYGNSTHGVLQWYDGSAISSSLWAIGEPDDFKAGVQACVSIQINRLHDTNHCDATSQFICEVPSNCQ